MRSVIFRLAYATIACLLLIGIWFSVVAALLNTASTIANLIGAFMIPLVVWSPTVFRLVYNVFKPKTTPHNQQ